MVSSLQAGQLSGLIYEVKWLMGSDPVYQLVFCTAKVSGLNLVQPGSYFVFCQFRFAGGTGLNV